MKKNVRPTVHEIFEHLHDHPEISWKETETTAYIASLLEKTNARIRQFDDCTGLVADLGQGAPVIAVRADIDALWQEVDGEFRANHSCGHDAHMAIVLEALYKLEERKDSWNGTIRFIFQPAEEKIEGALKMVEEGVIDSVEYLYGLHLRPVQELRTGEFAPGIQHGAVRFLKGEIKGEDAHGARPHLNKNAIELGAEVVQMMNSIHLDPKIPYSAKMTSFQSGGSSANIIPGNATFSIDLRARTNEAMTELLSKVEAIADCVSKLHGSEIKVKVASDVPAAVMSEEVVMHVERAINEVKGEDHVKPVIETTGGDDFHFYSIMKPELKATMLAIGCDLQPGLHHPDMTFDRRVLEEASDVIVETVLQHGRRPER
ncbi:M20 peptidase aminoacylase family protein [Halobacillus faecis]|uniref:Amidohydrolase AmhX n=1 Tax=Halobacillus faecis TaxID=360184 RepID=A0A511WTM8_9BACI|nr:M20 peptidase aminoacylase family protein [Halobacillus faecis]GEN54520.1 amidohydrolase AmhX [Halobacillus faecis]